jgi:hypothetical protein
VLAQILCQCQLVLLDLGIGLDRRLVVEVLRKHECRIAADTNQHKLAKLRFDRGRPRWFVLDSHVLRVAVHSKTVVVAFDAIPVPFVLPSGFRPEANVYVPVDVCWPTA